MDAYMKIADVGLMILQDVPAFYYGTSPNKFFDYLAAGLPVLNNYPGWIADLIHEHEIGIAIEPNSPAEFAFALEQLSNNKTRCAELGSNSLKLANEKFSREILTRDFVQFLEDQYRPSP